MKISQFAHFGLLKVLPAEIVSPTLSRLTVVNPSPVTLSITAALLLPKEKSIVSNPTAKDGPSVCQGHVGQPRIVGLRVFEDTTAAGHVIAGYR